MVDILIVPFKSFSGVTETKVAKGALSSRRAVLVDLN